MPIIAHCQQCGATFKPRPGQLRNGQGKFCSHECAAKQRSSLEAAAVRFWSRVQKSEGCWEWQGHILPSGYGAVMAPCADKRHPMRAHRLAYELAVGPIPEGLHVLHHCDNPRCVNPEHLWLGTHADNMGDRGRKGRARLQARRGEAVPMAKLTDEQVREIRRRYAAGETQTALGKEFGTAQNNVSDIVLRKRWTHIIDELEV